MDALCTTKEFGIALKFIEKSMLHAFYACKLCSFLYASFYWLLCGCSSGVERYLAKVEVESSNLFTRSIFVSFISILVLLHLHKIVMS